MTKRYDSTVARIAGNILSGVLARGDDKEFGSYLAERCVALARQIVRETERTEPPQATNAVDPSAQLPGTPTPRAKL